MPRWSKEDFEAYERKRANPSSHSRQPRPRDEKLQDAHNQSTGKAAEKTNADNSPREAALDGRNHPKFHIAVTLHCSDNRRRDIDGALSTLLDCLITSRRLLAVDTGNNDQGSGVRQRQ